MAKTTGKISGNLILVSIGGTTIACTTSASFNGTTERIETTCKDDGGTKTYEAGSQDGTFSVQGITKFDTASNFALVFAAWKNKTEAEFQLGGLDNADDPYVQFEGFISNVTWEGPLNAPSTWSFEAAPVGPFYIFNT
jgi:hypothetical protein